MNLLYAVFAFLLALVFGFVGITRVGSWLIERRNPAVGEFVDIDGVRIHYVHVPGPAKADLPPVVFIHGASANLRDQMLPLRPLLEGRTELLFFDRPGFGWSGRGPGNNEDPWSQAGTVAALMDHLGMKEAIIVGHSFGGAVTAAFGREHADKTLGLVFLAPATHPWPGGATAWYYDLTTIPVIGRLFSETLSYPAGMLRIAAATTCVFSPNKVPDNYVAKAAIPLVLRPSAFRANASDVASLHRHALGAAPRYAEIKAPTVIISGDRDKVVYAHVHSVGLERNIAGAELVWVRNLGHKPDWIASDLVVGAIEKVAGRSVDLEAMARAVEARVAGDAHGAGKCADLKEPEAELAPT
ncbi:alpha/beta hydrolase [Mesorhizobium sp. B292B1B]|uniref:alpha/beta fold hydrolase n=1 Tax=unclassified Mesorhizobium TaxID=325217 RepID=UPI001126AC0B|nr:MULTISPECIES: alpha/beta hydrolase [unclassified Mesorhizobium]MCA0011424.1 alpha/beta hydrolase [Mesorhizobium sp. B294B1A1]MCA0037004.1 alpha/beta hydrolase [Mesorhizobium sp. B292B1B]TPM46983.1 alpha/beta hydrolase [Mesorhizobium sp. B2-3-2]